VANALLVAVDRVEPGRHPAALDEVALVVGLSEPPVRPFPLSGIGRFKRGVCEQCRRRRIVALDNSAGDSREFAETVT
jgi:hypothetical protein